MTLAAVTGASGFIGGALCPRLAERGTVRGLFRRRTPATRAWRERGDEVVLGDLSDPDALASLVEGADVVYHLAARTSKDDPAASRRVNVEGSRRLARAAGEAGVGRLVYVSTISVYAATEPSDPGATAVERRGPDGVQTIDETVEPRNLELLNPYSATKHAGERAVREAAAAGEAPPATVVRPTNVYGPGARAWVLDWLERLERVPVVIGRGLPLDMVHVEDAADGIARAGTADGAAGETLHLAHQAVAMADYLAKLGEAAGLDVRRLPRWLDRLVRGAITRGHRLIEENRMSTPLTRRIRYPNDKARRVLGWEPAVELDEGLRDAARRYPEAGA